MVKVTCPRCGEQGYYETHSVAGRRYLYVVHGTGKKRRKCYIGPVDSYVHADMLLTLGLTNVKDIDYLEVAVNALERLIADVKMLEAKENGREEALEKLKIAEKRLTGYIEEIRRLREEIEEEVKREEELEVTHKFV
jgi:hypothetical protein